uniref:Zinc metalloproteinase-disintegrin-like atrase-A n=1 Tax=Actinia tenebrosa TaxID=6105 RepID=A0A6P8I559_ACTTE
MRKAGLFLIVFVVLLALVLRIAGFRSDRQHFPDEFLENYEVVHLKRVLDDGRYRRSADPLSTVYKNGHQEEISFSVEGFGRRFVLQLSRNRGLLPKGSRHSFVSSKGILTSQPFKSIDNCYYHGTIKGLPKSSVAISTCGGIEGLIFDGNERFYIQPSEEIRNTTHANPHIMFKMSDLKLPKVKCGHDHEHDVMELLHTSKIKTRKRRNIDSETKYIELVLVNDNSQYKYYQENTTQRALKIVNYVDSFYRALKVRVALIEMITWKDKDEILVGNNSNKALANFVKWRNVVLMKNRTFYHDNTQLLTHMQFERQTVGKAHVLAICTTRSAGVVRDHSSNAAATAATLAHEMGHNLGLDHDDRKECKCPAKKKDQVCIMSGVARFEPATDWSSCSVKEFQKMLDKGLDSCLFNEPKELYGDPVCGNGFKEEGEECDCGNYTECEKYTDNCCDPRTCKLLSHVECDEGPCCEKCKFKSSKVLCRKKVTECDLPEFCSGSSSLCPSNKYVYNGKPCDGGKGFCYGGICPTHDSQCEVLWGKDVKSGPKLCYTANERGNHLGSCKLEDEVYTACKKKDIFCGTLHCTNTKTDLPVIGSDRKVYKYTYKTEKGPIECRSASLDLGRDVPDPGMTKEGTKCGDEKVCLGQECVNVTQLYLSNPKCPGDCSSHGVCNNEGDCFCDDGWGGRDCSKNIGLAGQSKLAGYVILVFLCIALVAGCVGGFIFRDQLKTKWQERQQSRQKRYRSVEGKPTLSPSSKTASETLTDGREVPSVTIAPKPPPPPASRPVASRQPGKIELPSWPAENRHDELGAPVPRRAPPGIPKQSSLNRASSPPIGSYDSKPAAGARPGSYAGVLDTTPVNKPPQRPSPLAGLSQGSTNRPLLPSEIKKSQETIGGVGPRPAQPHKPARMPPPLPSKPPATGFTNNR